MKELKVEGKWHLPGKKEVVVGTLTFTEAEGCLLRTFGFFPGVLHSLKTKFPIVLGEAYRIKYTLISVTVNEYQADRKGYTASYILEGYHLTVPEQLFANGIRFSFDSLNQWIGIPGLKKMGEISEKRIYIKYNQPKPVLFEISECAKGKLFFKHISSFNAVSQSIISQEAFVELKFLEGKLSYEKALEKLVTFYQFITFAIQRPSRIINIILLSSEKKAGKNKTMELGFYFKMREIREEEFPLTLFSFYELSDFSDTLSKWFMLESTISPTIKMLFETYFPVFTLNENDFKFSKSKFKGFSIMSNSLPNTIP
jgi:hypothetical protein